MQFDKESGKFIKEIGQYARGPSGYRATNTNSTYIEKHRIILAMDWDGSYCGFNLLGEKSINFKKPGTGSTLLCGFLNDSTLAGYIPNHSGKEENKIVLFNKGGKITKIFPNHLSFDKQTERITVIGNEGLFYNYKDHLFLKEVFNDTLFEVEENFLTTRFVFEMGEYSPPYNRREELLNYPGYQFGSVDRGLDDYFRMTNIVESLRFILFEFDYQK